MRGRPIVGAHGRHKEKKTGQILQPYETAEQDDYLEPTPREKEVLAYMADGFTTKQTGKKLGISYWTAYQHLENVRVLFGARNRVHAVAIALRRGYIK